MIKTVLVNCAGQVIGQDHHRARLTDAEIDLIVELRAEGLTYPQIAEKFEISKGQAHDYFTGRRRGQVATGQKQLDLVQRRFRPTVASPDEFD